MWKNLYQKTVYEAYKTKEHLGYKIFEFGEMFVVLWNNQQMFYWNIAHCNKIENYKQALINSFSKGKY